MSAPNDQRMCPLLTVGAVMRAGPSQTVVDPVLCKGAQCALWVEEACAIALLPGAILSMAVENEDEGEEIIR